MWLIVMLIISFISQIYLFYFFALLINHSFLIIIFSEITPKVIGAAFAEKIAICEEAEESPLGPIKTTLTSSNIDGIIDWIVYEN